MDKNGNLLKFSRDLESDWIIKNDKPHYGLKGHASVDVDHGFVLSTELTPASVSDSIYLPYCVATSCHTEEPIKKVYADKGYYGKPNSGFLHMNGIEDGIMRKNTRSTKLTDYEKERNKGISKKRYIVEQYFGLSHLHSRAFRARFHAAAVIDFLWIPRANRLKNSLETEKDNVASVSMTNGGYASDGWMATRMMLKLFIITKGGHL